MISIGIGLGITRHRGRPFSPANIPGLVAWYDPSDLSTMFKNIIMTTDSLQPNTVPSTGGDPVAVMLDKSLSVSLGPEIADPDTQEIQGSSSTTANGVGWDIVTSASFPGVRQPGVEPNTVYKVKAKFINKTAQRNWSLNSDFPHPSFGGSLDEGEIDSYVISSSSLDPNTGFLLWRAAAAQTGDQFYCEITSLKEVRGVHIAQRSVAMQPIYQSGGTLADDGVDDALILSLTGTYSVYMAHGSTLEYAEDVVMAEDYDVLRDGLIGAVVTDDPLDAVTRARLATFWGVT